MRKAMMRPLTERSKVKDYKVLELIGEGNYGQVWEAKHSTGKRVAIKSFARLAQAIREDKLVKEILREAMAQANVSDENVVQFIDHDLDRGCIIFEFLDTSLDKEIKERYKEGNWFVQDEALELIRGILEGLKAIHNTGIIHGDLKPANVLLTKRHTPKISDFGMSSILTKRRFPLPIFRASSNWIAPEVLEGKEVSYQSDLFSVGVIAYLLFSEQHPFYQRDPMFLKAPADYIKDYAEDHYHPKPLKEIKSEIPDMVSSVVEKLLAKDPQNRFQRAEDVLMSLSRLEAPTPPEKDRISVDVEAIKDMNQAIFEAKRIFHGLYEPQKAISILTETIEKYKESNLPHLANVCSYKAFLHNYLEEWDKSIEVASLGIKLDPAHCDSHMARGYAYMNRMHMGNERKNKGDLDKAFTDLTMAQQLVSDYRKETKIQQYLNQLNDLGELLRGV
ncbi:MAG: serine/threonine protein kinase [Candidatus Omnitrophica bacterium]|nr:serine/threonine protein kinase [Candidatus Omnitrophota bacterium]